MDYTTLKNRTFGNYYFNSYLPGTLGAYEASTIFNYLMTIESLQENITSEMDISKVWFDNTPTWYTPRLPNLFFIPRYVGESGQDYIDRILLLVNVNQNEDSVIKATYSVIKDAIDNINNIQIIDRLEAGASGAIWGDGGGSPPDDWDGSKVWLSEYSVQRTMFLVNINFSYRGSSLDSSTWDYWILPENYTKIEDMIKLYKPPGSTFEMRVNIPEDFEQVIEIFSNTLIA